MIQIHTPYKSLKKKEEYSPHSTKRLKHSLLGAVPSTKRYNYLNSI